jgi:hypothetical protein
LALGKGTIVRFAQIFIALAVSIALGWFVWSRIDSARLAAMLASVPRGMLMAMIATYLLYQVLRAWRLRIVFPSIAQSFPGLVTTMCVQSDVNTVLPLWLGDVATIALLRRRHVVQAGSGAAGVLLARGVDLLLHVVVFLVALEIIYSMLVPAHASPITGIADFGSHEAVWNFLLRLLGEGTETAAATAFGSHILILVAVVTTSAVGLIGIAAGQLRAMAPS